MKKWIWILLVSAFLICAYFAVTIPAVNRERLRHRAELYMLDTLKAGISNRLHEGEPLPTNWISLSNSVEFEKARSICEYNHLPSPDKMYSILAKKVAIPGGRGGFVFMVRSEPCGCEHPNRGRWVLITDQPLPKGFSGAKESNRISRVWWPGDDLPQEIRSQLANKH